MLAITLEPVLSACEVFLVTVEAIDVASEAVTIRETVWVIATGAVTLKDGFWLSVVLIVEPPLLRMRINETPESKPMTTTAISATAKV